MSSAAVPSASSSGYRLRPVFRFLLLLGAAVVTAALVWQGIIAHGAPDPTLPHTSFAVASLDIAVLVFREGLECILVLSAIMASMIGPNEYQRKPVGLGVGVGILVTLATWFIATGIVNDLSKNISALDLQAGTGLLAVVVLLVIMNWFFHKVYWGGWICFHNRRKKSLLNEAKGSQISRTGLLWGLGLLGFSSFYREGFEVVLFLQSYHLRMGNGPILIGALVGSFLSGIVAVLTFFAHRRLPYRKMLVLTGTMLGFVLLVMVGEQAQEMQLAQWIPTTKIGWLAGVTPDWMGLWFSFYPTVETLTAQALAALLVLGSYFIARRQRSSGSPIAAPTPV
jgi:high-affinity iron transporter